MDNVTRVLESILGLLALLGGLIMQAIVAVEVWVRGLLGSIGVPQQIQTAVLIAVAVVLVLAVFRLFGGLIRVAVGIILILVVIHLLVPVIHV